MDQYLTASPKTQRLLVWMALALGTIYFAAMIMMGIMPPPPPNMSVNDVGHFYADSNFQFRLGALLAVLTGGFHLPWTLIIAINMNRIEQRRSIWTTMQLLSGFSGAWLFSLPPIAWATAAFNAGRPVETTAIMHEFGFLIFFCMASYWYFQLISIGVVALSKHNTDPDTAFPRWMGFLTIFCGLITGEGFIGVMFNSGPFSWNGLFVFHLPIVCYVIWMSTTAFMMLRAAKPQEEARRSV